MANLKSNNRPRRAGLDLLPPYGVHLDGEQLAVYPTREQAAAHYKRLCQSLMKPAEAQWQRDRTRHALQTPIASPRYQVLYLNGGKEHRSPWLYRREHAQRALAAMQAKYGTSNACIYAD